MVEVNGSIFIGGSNLGPKIATDTKGGVQMWYDDERDKTFMVHKGKLWIGEAKGMVISNPAQFGVEVSSKSVLLPTSPYAQGIRLDLPPQPVKAQVSGPEVRQQAQYSAQVSTPISQPPRKPGRPPKYQGEDKPE